MVITVKRFTPILLAFFVISILGLGYLAQDADARSRSGGRSFSTNRTYKPPVQSPTKQYSTTPKSGGFMRGLAGGLIGGAIGSMLFGSLVHAGEGGGLFGSGIGLFQILLLAGIGYFVYSRFFKKKAAPAYSNYQSSMGGASFPDAAPGGSGHLNYPPPPPPSYGGGGLSLAEGIALIRRSEPDFDPDYFTEVAQDVFFQVQAGWMRRDLDSYRHLLGDNLAAEYANHFAEMKAKGHINKLENIAVRKVELMDAGVDGHEEFATVLFTANLLDYTVDEHSGAVVDGSDRQPVKFAEKWTWARPTGTQIWKLEGIEVVRES